jgi:RNA polymerase sigma factor (sigma-70 family)
MKSNKMIEIDNLVVEYQQTKNQEVANKLYDKFKWYFRKYGNDDESISLAHLAFARAIDSYDEKSNVWFIKWFQLLWFQHRNERSNYNNQEKRSGVSIVPIDSMAYKNNDEIKVSEIIADEEQIKMAKKRENTQMFLEFLQRDDIEDREREILKNIYLEKGKFQTDIAKEMGISQAMVHKTIKKIHKKPYADELKKLLYEMMQNG